MMNCPHGHTVQLRTWAGIAYYEHQQEGDSCFFLNHFELAPHTILEELVRRADYGDTATVYAALLGSEHVQACFFKELSQECGEERLLYLLRMLVIHGTKNGGKALLQQAAKTFGDVLAANIGYLMELGMIEKGDYSWLSMSSSIPLLPMMHITEHKTIADMQFEIRQREKRVQHSLERLRRSVQKG